MEKNGCSLCGRHPEEEAPTCPKCGLEMPTKGHRRVFQKVKYKYTLGGLLVLIGLLMPYSDFFEMVPLSFPIAIGLVIAGFVLVTLGGKM